MPLLAGILAAAAGMVAPFVAPLPRVHPRAVVMTAESPEPPDGSRLLSIDAQQTTECVSHDLHVTIPEQRVFNGRPFPFAITPKGEAAGSLASWGAEHLLRAGGGDPQR